MRSTTLPDLVPRLQDHVRAHLRLFLQDLSVMWLSAYGEYDDVVLKVAAERLQQLVNWDFECVLWLLYREMI